VSGVADVRQDLLALFDGIDDALVVARISDGRILHVNPRGAAVLGRPAAELLGLPLHELMPAGREMEVHSTLHNAAAGVRLIPSHEVAYARPDGRVATVRVSGAIVQSGGETLALMHLTDVDEGREADRLLREAQDRYKAVVETAADPIFVIGRDGRFQSVNAAAARHFRSRPEDLIGRTMQEMFPPAVADRQAAMVRQVIETGLPIAAHVSLVELPIGRRRFDTSLTPVKDARGQVKSVVGIARDVTDRILAEEAVRRSEERFRDIVENMSDGLYVVDLDGRYQFVNRTLANRTGIPADDFKKLTYFDLLPKEEAEKVAAIYDRIVHGEDVPSFEFFYFSRDGRKLDIEVRPRPIRVDGRVVAIQGLSRDVTQRKRAEEVLRESERKYRELVDNTDDAVFALDAEGRFTFANRVILGGPGVSLEALAKVRAWDMVGPEDRDRLRAKFEQAMRGEKLEPFELAFPDAKLGQRVTEVVSRPILDGGRIVGIQGAARDITDRLRAEMALRESEARYRAVVDLQTEMIDRFLPDGTLTFVNEACCRFVGRTREELVGTNFLAWLPEDDARKVAAQIAAMTTENPVITNAHSVSRRPGDLRWLSWIDRGIFDADGRLVEVQAVGRDITEQRLAEEALRRSEATYHAIFDGVNEALFVHDPVSGEVLNINSKVTELYGYGPDEVGRLSADMRAATQEPYSFQSRLRVIHAAAAGTPQLIEWLTRRKDGTRFWVEGNVTCASIGGRDVVLAAVRDISQRKAVEEALRQSEENYRLLFEQNTLGIAVSSNGLYVRVNEALARIFRRTPEEFIGLRVGSFAHPDHRQQIKLRVESKEAGAEVAGGRPNEYRIIRADGSEGWVAVRSGRMTWEGKPAVLGMMQDISDRRRMEEELREAYKMEAVGQLAGGIAHDFNNIMTGILCHAGLLKTGAASPDDVRETAGIIEGAARRAAQLTSQLLGFARRGKHQVLTVDLNAAIEASVALLSRTLEPGISIETRFNARPAWISGDPAQMEQAVLNLAMNARDAMPDGGKISLTTDVVELPAGRPSPAVDAPAARPRPTAAEVGRYVVMTVRDTGAGIPPELLGRIFEPFFTTKPPGKGSGLGLAMVYGIVRNHGGWIEVESAPATGTTFRVFLPMASPPSAEQATAAQLQAATSGLAAPPAAHEAAPAAGTAMSDSSAESALSSPESPARILVVEDEELVRNVLARMLAAMGYNVVTAANGREAVDICRRTGADIDLAIIDMIMHDMNGAECFKALRSLKPGVRAILSTGAAPDGALQLLLDAGLAGFVLKPYQADELAAAVRKALRAKAPGGSMDKAPGTAGG